MGKKTVFIAWRFKESQTIELESHTLVAFKTNGEQLIQETDFQLLLREIGSIQEHLYLFLHKPNFDGNHNGNNILETLKGRKDKTKCVDVTDFHGGNHPVYSEFIDQDESTLRTITNEDAERKLSACIVDPFLEALIHLHKTLSLTVLKKEEANLKIMKNDFKYKDAFKLWKEYKPNNPENAENLSENVENILKWTLVKIQERFQSK